ncbi:MAG: hypothetical protein GY940_20275 [bacterium]|nr:hypothetical protein [bacterium]
MNRRIPGIATVFICSILLFSVTLWSAQTNTANNSTRGNTTELPMIVEIGFVPGQFENAPPLPKVLALELRATSGVFYKLSYNDQIISSGIFVKDENRLEIPTEELFQDTGTYIFILETRVDSYRFKYRLSIDIQLQSRSRPGAPGSNSTSPFPPGQLFTQSTPPIQYSLEMYIKGHLAARSRKEIFSGLTYKQRKGIQRALETVPGNPMITGTPGDPSPPGGGGLSVIDTIIAVSKLLKKKGRPPLPRNLSISYRKKDETGVFIKHHAKLSVAFGIIK